MSARIRVAKKRFKKYNPLFIGFVKQQLLPGKELFYISSSFDKIRCEIEDIINEYMKNLPIAFQITASPILLTKHPVRITDIEYLFSGTIFIYRPSDLKQFDYTIQESYGGDDDREYFIEHILCGRRGHLSPIDHIGLQAGIYESKQRFFVDDDN